MNPALIRITFTTNGIGAGLFRKSVRKLRIHGFDLRNCEPISYRKHLRICGKKSKIYRKSAK